MGCSDHSLKIEVYEGDVTDPNDVIVPLDQSRTVLYSKRGSLICLWSWDPVSKKWIALITP